MNIRQAIIQDAPTIAAAEAETARQPGLLVSRPGEIPIEAYTSKIQALADRGRYIVAEKNGHLVGHALLDPMGLNAVSHVFRLTIVAHPGNLGRGVGTAMLADLLQWAESDPRVGKIELLVRATNTPAIQLYERFGFTQEGRFRSRIKLPDGQMIDDVAMAWFPVRGQAP
jgi:putative acetyltransferase